MSLSDSPDWRPVNEAQRRTFLNAFPGQVQMLDASLYSGGGVGVFVTIPLAGKVDKARFDGEVAGFIKGITNTGPTLLNRQAAHVSSLPGVSATFQGKSNGKVVYILADILFTDRAAYAIGLYTAKPLARTDPMAASYEARIKVDPSTVPASVAPTESFSLADLSRRQFGNFSGTDLLVCAVAVISVALIVKFVPGR